MAELNSIEPIKAESKQAKRYKQKVIFLSGLVGILALLYGGTLIFDPERVNNRNAAYVWLDPKAHDLADRIEISGSSGDITLVRKNNTWFVSRNEIEYPAKQSRIADLLQILSSKGSYPVRGVEASSHERLGVSSDTASRILIRGGAAAYPLLDLLVGYGDATGREIYLRKNTEHQVRSGEDKVSGYINSSSTAWYDLRLFREHENPGLSAESVQRLMVYAPISYTADETEAADSGNTPASPLILTRNQNTWSIDGAAVTTPDNQRIESYIRAIIDAEGEDFIDALETSGLDFNEGHIILELGNGTTRTIRIGPMLESNRRSAVVSGSSFVYSLAEWTMSRLFRDGSYFEKQ